MRVTTKGRYALRALVQLAVHKEDTPLSVKDITEQEKISPIFLEQIFTKLKKYGLIKSIRGVGGGFLLDRAPRDITVRDILEAVEEKVQLVPCCSSEEDDTVDCVHFPKCRISNFWEDVNKQLNEIFASYSLERIIREYELTDREGHC